MYKKSSDNNSSFFSKANKHNFVLICFAVFLLSNFSAFSQSGRYPVKRIRSYQQQTVGGANTGRDRTRVKKTYDWIYLELWPGKSIEITDLWINNEKTGFEPEKIESPVYSPESKKKKIIIPTTSGEVLQLIKTELAENESASLRKIPHSYRHFPILIRYLSEEKIYYLGVYPKGLKTYRGQ